MTGVSIGCTFAIRVAGLRGEKRLNEHEESQTKLCNFLVGGPEHDNGILITRYPILEAHCLCLVESLSCWLSSQSSVTD